MRTGGRSSLLSRAECNNWRTHWSRAWIPLRSERTRRFTSCNQEIDGWTVSAPGQSGFFDAVIIATPAPAAAALLETAGAGLASELRSIHYSSSVTVALGYGQEVRRSLPPGFGFLVPRSEGKRMLASTFVHNKFPHRAPPDRALLRCFVGGSRDEPVLDLADEEILRIVGGELRQILGITAEPRFTRVYRWRGAMAQYTVGHLDRLERIEGLRRQLPRSVSGRQCLSRYRRSRLRSLRPGGCRSGSGRGRAGRITSRVADHRRGLRAMP